jgi:hypothetical protein
MAQQRLGAVPVFPLRKEQIVSAASGILRGAMVQRERGVRKNRMAIQDDRDFVTSGDAFFCNSYSHLAT